MKINRFAFLASAIALIISISPSVTKLGKTNARLIDNNKIESIVINRKLKDNSNQLENVKVKNIQFEKAQVGGGFKTIGRILKWLGIYALFNNEIVRTIALFVLGITILLAIVSAIFG